MSPAALIAHCRDRGVALTPALDFDGPADALGADVIALLRDRKADILRHLVGPAGADPRAETYADWRSEWLRETGMLALRWRDAADAEVKAALREVLTETPRTEAEWLILEDIIGSAEFDLRRAGKLPPVPNYEA